MGLDTSKTVESVVYNGTAFALKASNPNALTMKLGDTTYVYDGSLPVTVVIDDGTEVSY